MKKISEAFRGASGIFLTILVGVCAFYMGKMHKLLDPLVIGIILGMLVRFVMGARPMIAKGADAATKVFIPIGIVIYGVNLKFNQMGVVPFVAWIQILIGIIIIFWLGWFLSKQMGISSPLAFLICVGTAICGASAIAIATPVIKGKSEETSISLLVITVFGFIGVVVFPFIADALMINAENYALLCATTLHQTGFVKVAASHFSADCLKIAMIIKMARTCMIIPILITASFLVRRGLIHPDRQREQRPYSVFKDVPWYLWVFIFVGILFSFVPFFHPFAEPLTPVASLFWTMAMVGLGLLVDLRQAFSKLIKPMVFGFLIWAALIGNFFIAYYGMGY